MLEKWPSADPLGTDLALDPSGDLIVTVSGSAATVSDQENVAQAVRVRLMTIPYTYLWGSEVGTQLAEFVDRPVTDRLVREVQVLVQGALERDSRIQELLDVRVESAGPDALSITVQALVAALGPVEIPIIVGR